jgi:hypothetical protein
VRHLPLQIALLLAIPLAVCACGLPQQPAAEATRELRVMIVPAPQSGLDPASPDGVAHLSRAAGVPLVYLRALGGGGHLLATETPVSASAAEKILRRLADDPAVARAEEDRRVTHQLPPLEP